ncbi:MAG: hypothetical protein IJ587_01855, partial [Synergistaceae bacterium]|nr:hypothetical protein [Synergistaceae bacterium]
EENSGSSQSAEDKLKANIAQALSESPIAAAQSNSHQDFEQDINPFDEISLPDTLMPQNDEEQEQEINTDEVPPDDEAVDEAETQDDEPFDIASVPETENENDIDTADETETAEDPFALSEENFDEPEQFEPVEVSSEAETDDVIDEQPEVDSDSEPEPETLTNEAPFGIEADTDTEPEPELPPEEPEQPLVLEEDNTETEPQSVHDDFADLPFSLGDDDETDETPQEIPQIHEEPANEIESLTQEVAAARQENQIIQKEEEPVNNMPEETLLDDLTPENIEPENENHDDWDVNSLGELGAAATFSDDAPDEFHSVPETVTEIITQPESGAIHNPEEDHKEKTMNIREKLASRKKAASDDSPAKKKSSSGGGFLLPLLMGLTLIVGSLILWQLMQLSDKITSLAMNSSGFESVPVHETAPSYEYAIDFILDPNLNDRMSQRGREGWQVVGSRRTQDSTSGQYGYELIFMRRMSGR